MAIAAGSLSASAGVIHKCDDDCLTTVITPDYEVDGICYIIHGDKLGVASKSTVTTKPNTAIKNEYEFDLVEKNNDGSPYEGIIIVPEKVYIKELDKMLPVMCVELGAFMGCPDLISVSLPPDIRYLESNAFADSPNLESVELNNCNITELWENTFRGCKALKHIDIPSSVNYVCAGAFIGSGIESLTLSKDVYGLSIQAFTGADSLKSVICHVSSPSDIMITRAIFLEERIDVPEDCVLYVPEESVDEYKALYGWSNFADIRPIGSAAIKDAEAVTDDVRAPAYNLLGQPVANPRPGDFIIHNGKKLIVR